MNELPLMFFTVNEQMVLFLWSCVMGAGFGAVYDFFRIARIAIKHGKLAVAVQDVLFLFFCSVAIFVFSVEVGGGMVRFFFIIGSLLGFILYYLTVGQIVFFAANKIISAIKWVFRLLFRIFISPIIRFLRFFYRKTRTLFRHIKLKLKLFFNKAKIRLKDTSNLMYNNIKHTQNFSETAEGNVNTHGKHRREESKRKSKKEKE